MGRLGRRVSLLLATLPLAAGAALTAAAQELSALTILHLKGKFTFSFFAFSERVLSHGSNGTNILKIGAVVAEI